MTAALDLAALRALPRDVFPACEELNHEPADYHAAGGQCPVAVRVRAALDQIPALLDELAVLAACGVTEQTEDTLAEQVRMRIGDLEQVIDTAAKHWIALTIEHPVPWEGGIDEAMRAACDKIRRLALLAPAETS